jgi:hypothetical protein
MNWDDFGEATETATSTAAEQLCPDGTHVATIGWVKLQPKDWAKSKTNAEGKCLTVRLDFGKGIKAVFDSIPCDRRGSVEALCRSARVDPPAGEWDESQLKGQVVTVETVIALSKAGNDFVKVVKYKPNAEPLPKEIRDRPVNRTPTQKADAASHAPNDDIPF